MLGHIRHNGAIERLRDFKLYEYEFHNLFSLQIYNRTQLVSKKLDDDISTNFQKLSTGFYFEATEFCNFLTLKFFRQLPKSIPRWSQMY